MPARNLDKMFDPENIVVVGASEKEESVEHILLENLISRTIGEVFPVNINRKNILGKKAFSSVKEISKPIDLGVIATPAETVPGIVKECGEVGIPALIIISAGFSEVGPKGEKLEEQIEEIRENYGMRLLGPNCLGIIRPSTNLNASMADQTPKDGSLAFISQSGALATATLDWAISAQFGFSSFISVGNMIDVDFGDLIDYLGQDPKTHNILLYIESIENAERFMSAARGFARTNPVIAVKSGNYEESAQAVVSHTGAIAGGDPAYEAAFNRAGVTRVDTMDDLFISSETLAKSELPQGPQVVIISNTGGGGNTSCR
ncbi:MAG: hypothetical protein GWO20_14235 [Candidatus Korarchaeota archaeon]|nr:hypothetical protein [Candidatus Korarchaeota archaeon]NIU84574.1 hypothetical protein [Candidatus Thorarchaeota archaeon]NIW52709.1 hypothetical protein [Candidatus Korarchaeota archaeon]